MVKQLEQNKRCKYNNKVEIPGDENLISGVIKASPYLSLVIEGLFTYNDCRKSLVSIIKSC